MFLKLWWEVDENAIIIEGCSAGGHLAASYACMWKRDFVSKALLGDTKDSSKEKLRPNGLMLCYPVITSGKFAHRGSIENLLGDRYEYMKEDMSLENQVNSDVPKTFIWHTFTDGSVPVENSLLFATALRENNINTELHIFPEGGHGLSLANKLTLSNGGNEDVPSAAPWIDLATTWLDRFF